jgi:hypothetical protein
LSGARLRPGQSIFLVLLIFLVLPPGSRTERRSMRMRKIYLSSGVRGHLSHSLDRRQNRDKEKENEKRER